MYNKCILISVPKESQYFTIEVKITPFYYLTCFTSADASRKMCAACMLLCGRMFDPTAMQINTTRWRQYSAIKK